MPVQYEPQPGFWASVWDALRGTHQDFTTGDLNRSILLLAIPMVVIAECSIALGCLLLFRTGPWRAARVQVR